MGLITKCFTIISAVSCLLIGIPSCKNTKSDQIIPPITDTIVVVSSNPSDTLTSNPIANDTILKLSSETLNKEKITVNPSKKMYSTETPKSKKVSSSRPILNSSSSVKPETKNYPSTKVEKGDNANGDFVVEEKPVEIKNMPGTVNETPKNVKPNHDLFNGLLSKYVSPTGLVNYKVWKKNMSSLNEYVKDMADIDVNSLKGNEKIAYCINVYNANTIKLILMNYPVKSIQSIAGGKPWDERIVKTGNSYYSLNEWENSVIRKMGEPRVHFALNCAAKSCPILHNQAFTAENMNTKLQSLTSKFINGAENVISDDKMVLSKIFDWYKVDFGDSVIEYINKYVKTPSKSTAKITYKDYDWSLNE